VNQIVIVEVNKRKRITRKQHDQQSLDSHIWPGKLARVLKLFHGITSFSSSHICALVRNVLVCVIRRWKIHGPLQLLPMLSHQVFHMEAVELHNEIFY